LGHTFAQKKHSLFPDIFKSNLGPCHSICISRTLVSAVGTFDEKLKSVEDWDFWIRAIKAGGIQKIISTHLVYYRYAKTSMSRDAFVMYKALKTVIDRGPVKDSRITIDSALNKEYNFDVRPVLNQVLLRSLGVSIMQGKIEESICYFKEESSVVWQDYKPEKFEIMCSYLTFRYWYSPSDIKEVYELIYPNFDSFFKQIQYPYFFRKKAMYYIFKRHLNYKYQYKFGKYFGRFLSLLYRVYFEKKI
jgi:hypothetical protein